VTLSVILLGSIGATSIIGTLIPQNESHRSYLEAFGDFYYRLFLVFDFFDMYHSWWFQLLILLLTLNIIICSIDRLSSVWKIVFVKEPPFRIARFRSTADKIEFTDNRHAEELEKVFPPLVTKGFGYSRIEKTDDGFCIFAEKWRWTRLGVYIVHLSIIFLLVGALIGSLYGFDGYVNIPEGGEINSVSIRNSQNLQKLDFTVRCDDFNVSYYESGSPKEYRSSLTVLESGKPVLHKDIVVNDPLRFKGVNFFQSSYGTLPPESVTLLCKSKSSGESYKIDLKLQEPVNLPEDMGKLVINNYGESISYRGRAIGEAFTGVLIPEDQKPVNIVIPIRFPTFDEMRNGSQTFSIASYDHRYYPGLQVTRDPGVWIVYTGFIFMIVGCFITFFMSHERICVEVTRSKKRNKIMVAGISNKNKLGMKNKLTRLYNSLREK
jgi:cytochrome c biogenesis protein